LSKGSNPILEKLGQLRYRDLRAGAWLKPDQLFTIQLEEIEEMYYRLKEMERDIEMRGKTHPDNVRKLISLVLGEVREDGKEICKPVEEDVSGSAP
jgi:hypothetical protein